MEQEEIIEKLDKFFDKQGLEIEGKFFLCKRLMEDYWEEIRSEGEEPEAEEPEVDDFEEAAPQDPFDVPPTPPKKKGIKAKKPKVSIKA